MKFYITLLLLISISFTSNAQNMIKWVTMEEAIEAQKTTKKKILVNIFTDWCENCKKLDQFTYRNNDIAKYINKNYYPVKLNAEYKKPITFKSKKYNAVKLKNKKYHELAIELSFGNLVFPTQVFLDENLEVIQSIGGYQSTVDMIKIAVYYGDNIYKGLTWSSYKNSSYYKKYKHTVKTRF